MRKVGVGVIGCGMISEIYMTNCTKRYTNLNIVACSDINPEAANRRAEQFGCKAMSTEELLKNPEVEIVLNLTVPAQHAKVSLDALRAGKHVYAEKPMFVEREEGQEMMEYAAKHGLMIGNAPDCFMGAGQQTVRKLLDDGVIGKPFAAQAFMFSRGPEYFHPNPKFFYEKGAGPVLDWGPYYVSSLVSLFGPVKKIVSKGLNPVSKRIARAEKSPYYNQEFDVEVPTYVTSILEFESGFVANLTTSFDMQYPYFKCDLPFIRIFGTNGSIDVPDVNMYKGPVVVTHQDGSKEEYPLVSEMVENSRGLGLSDMARALVEGGDYLANGEFGNHVADILNTIQESVECDKYYEIASTCAKPAPLTNEVIEKITR